jgi:hypothetical protein
LRLNSVIYKHRISDPRIGGAIKKNLRMFKKLCGNHELEKCCQLAGGNEARK